ncbi:hypothetical protein EDB81DRAFT_860524 [Dactylonectria macrodidyma]|uniref:Rhodopsin domain-containing protein n=1 Tax=Dactylonectria macrodidyma TaxID=307937 RepID=A0A9P9DVG9_9HYPO|nr:hypothetical protein EDB81DRAFT_860524 [Dactylonectria macrodidyma]
MSGALPTLIGVTATLLTLITTFVAIRFFVRSVLLRRIDWDDALVFTSWSLAVALLSTVFTLTNVGLGSHLDDVSDDNLREFLRLQTVASLTYIWGFVTVKMSFAVLYFRLIPGTFYRRINQGLLVLLLAQGIEECLVVILKCNPVDKAWMTSKQGTCLDLRSFYYASFGIKFTTDIVLFAQPIPAIWRLQLSAAKRIGVLVMLSLGLFVCVISIIRVTYIAGLKDDITLVDALVDSIMWSEVEICALIMCACIPSFRPFFRCFPWVNRVLGLSSDEASSSSYQPDIFLGQPSITSPNRSFKHHPLQERRMYQSPELRITHATTQRRRSNDHASFEGTILQEVECSVRPP